MVNTYQTLNKLDRWDHISSGKRMESHYFKIPAGFPRFQLGYLQKNAFFNENRKVLIDKKNIIERKCYPFYVICIDPKNKRITIDFYNALNQNFTYKNVVERRPYLFFDQKTL